VPIDSDYIAQRLQAFDAGIDVTKGSPAQAHVILPLLAKLGTDPLSTPIREFLLARLREEHPDLAVGTEADTIVDILVDPLVSFLEPFKRELTTIKQSQSTADPDLLSEAEADALLANLFFDRPPGTKAQFTVRLYYVTPTAVEVNQLTRYGTVSGLSFFPATTQSITSASMLLNQEGALYFFDTTVEAEKVGTDHNVAVGAISIVEGLPTLSKAKNLTTADVKGSALESNSEFIDRAEVALSERTMNTERGLAARLMALLPAITKLQGIGYRDIEMERDVIKGSLVLSAGDLGLGPIVNMAASGLALVGSYDFGDDVDDTVGLTTFHRRLLGVQILKADLKVSPPVVGNTVSVHHATRLTANKSDQVVDADHVSDHIIASVVETPLDATKWDILFDDYRLIDQSGETVQTVVIGSNVTGAVLPFSNTLEQTVPLADFLKPGDPASPGDLLMVEYSGGNDEAAFRIGTVVSATRVIIDEGLAVIAEGIGDNQAADPADNTGISIKVANGADKIGVPDAMVTGTVGGAAGWVNRHIVMREDGDDSLVAGVGAQRYFKVKAIADAGSWPDGADRTEVTLDVDIDAATAPDDDNYKWSLVAKDSLNTAAANLELGADGAAAEAGDADAPIPLHPSTNMKWVIRRDKSGASMAGFVDGNAINDLLYSERAPLAVAAVNAGIKLTLSDIPGGIAFPDTAEGELTIDNDTIHIGGMTDAYMRVNDNVDGTPLVLDLEDDEPLAQGVDGSNPAGGSSILTSATVDFGAKGVRAGDVLVVKDDNPGSYRVTKVAGLTVTVINHADPTAEAFANVGANVRFEVVRTITVDLVSPKDTKIPNNDVNDGTSLKNPKDLTTFAASARVESRDADNLSYVDYLKQGAEVGDVLEIFEGQDKGVYSIVAIGGDFPNDEITLDTVLIGGQTGLEYRIYKPAANGGITLPLLRVSSIDRLDANGQSVGIKIPYADPVDVRSSDFGNRGTGLKVPNDTMPGNDLYTTTAGGVTTVEANGDTDFIKSRIAPGDVLAWSSGVHAGLSYQVESVTDLNTLILEEDVTAGGLADIVDVAAPGLPDFTLGAPSIGSARCYFLEPTTFSVDNASATFVTASGLTYKPDPDNNASLHDPDLPGVAALDVANPTHVNWVAPYPTVYELGLKVGDDVEVGYRRLKGSKDLADAANQLLAGKTLIVEIHGGSTITITFAGANPVVPTTAVAPGGVLEQVKAALPSIFKVEMVAPPDDPAVRSLALSSKSRFTIKAGTANGDLGFADADTNWHADVGVYPVATLAVGGDVRKVALTGLTGVTLADVQLEFIRPSTQRISSTDMAANLEEGLYYFDVQMISAEADDKFNIVDDTEMTVAGHESEGYRLRPVDTHHTFSSGEKVKLEVSPIALRAGTKDLLVNADLLPGSKVQIAYERAPTVSSAQDILLLDSERVINDNPLSRHFFPSYVRFVMEYSGGSEVAIVKKDLVAHVDGLKVGDPLEAFDLQVVARERNANYVREPLTMVAVTHKKDRTIKAYRSTDRVTAARNEFFVADEDNIVVTRI
jgi:hypothetical protein